SLSSLGLTSGSSGLERGPGKRITVQTDRCRASPRAFWYRGASRLWFLQTRCTRRTAAAGSPENSGWQVPSPADRSRRLRAQDAAFPSPPSRLLGIGGD